MTILKSVNKTDEMEWVEVCQLADITPNTGVGAIIHQQQIALFRVGNEKRVYALSNQDPFSQAFDVTGDCRGSTGRTCGRIANL